MRHKMLGIPSWLAIFCVGILALFFWGYWSLKQDIKSVTMIEPPEMRNEILKAVFGDQSTAQSE
jgi:hypothetical protein